MGAVVGASRAAVGGGGRALSLRSFLRPRAALPPWAPRPPSPPGTRPYRGERAVARAAGAAAGERKRVELEDGRELAVGVRLGTPADVDVLVDFNCRLAEESENIVLDRDVVTRGVANCISQDVGRYFLLESGEDGDVLGSLMITYEWSDWRDGMVWWVQSVYVRREARKRGLFKFLYKTVRAQAAAEGARGVRLYVDNDNEVALKTYEKLGMGSHYKVMEDMF